MSVSKNTRGRPLGFAESMHQLFLTKYSTCVYWHTGVIHSTALVPERMFIDSLKILARNHGTLRMCIRPLDQDETNPTTFKFEPMRDPNKIDFDVVRMNSKDDWPSIVSKDHAEKKIDHTNGPLWRFVLGLCQSTAGYVYEYVLLFKFHHAITDAKGASDLMYRQYLPILSALTNGLDAESLFPFIPQPESLEQIFVPENVRQEPAAGSKHTTPQNSYIEEAQQDFRFPDDHTCTDLLCENVCVPKIFGEELTSNVIASAKSNGVTVHTVLLVAGAMAFSRTAEAAKVKLPETFKQMWAIDLRKFSDFKTPQPVGLIASFAYTTHSRITGYAFNAFWDSCRQTYLAVKAEKCEDKIMSMFGNIQDFRQYIADCRYETYLKETGMDYFIALSNLGNVNADIEPELAGRSLQIRMAEQFFCLSGPVTFNPFFQSMITFRGKFMWTILHHPRKVSRKFVDTYYCNLEDILKSYCKQQ